MKKTLKKGDKVKVKSGSHTAYDGQTCIIVCIDDEMAIIKFDIDGNEDELSIETLEPIK